MWWLPVVGSGRRVLGLVASSPAGPDVPVCRRVVGPDGQGDEESLDLVAGQPDQSVRGAVLGVFVGPNDGEEGVGEYGQSDPADPGGVAADLMLVQSGQALLGLEGLFHRPP